jgi:hypothetical protein
MVRRGTSRYPRKAARSLPEEQSLGCWPPQRMATAFGSAGTLMLIAS